MGLASCAASVALPAHLGVNPSSIPVIRIVLTGADIHALAPSARVLILLGCAFYTLLLLRDCVRHLRLKAAPVVEPTDSVPQSAEVVYDAHVKDWRRRRAARSLAALAESGLNICTVGLLGVTPLALAVWAILELGGLSA